jgi:hypothetical protein
MSHPGWHCRLVARIHAIGLTEYVLKTRVQMGLKKFLEAAEIPRNVPDRIINGKLSEKDVEYWRQFALEASRRLEPLQRKPLSKKGFSTHRRLSVASHERYKHSSFAVILSLIFHL